MSARATLLPTPATEEKRRICLWPAGKWNALSRFEFREVLRVLCEVRHCFIRYLTRDVCFVFLFIMFVEVELQMIRANKQGEVF